MQCLFLNKLWCEILIALYGIVFGVQILKQFKAQRQIKLPKATITVFNKL